MKIDYYILSWFMTIIVGSIFSGIVFGIALNDWPRFDSLFFTIILGLFYSFVISLFVSIPGLIISTVLIAFIKKSLSKLLAIQVSISSLTVLFFFYYFSPENYLYPSLGLIYIPIGIFYTNHFFK